MITVSSEVAMGINDSGQVVLSTSDCDNLGGRDLVDMVKEYCNLFSFDDGILSSDCIDLVEILKSKLETSLLIVNDHLIKTRQYELQSLE
jgi:hypothetical protein